MSRKSYPLLQTSEARALIEKIHEDVAQHHERYVIARPGSDKHCVLVSQAELDALERAVEILSGTRLGCEIQDLVTHLSGELAHRPRVTLS